MKKGSVSAKNKMLFSHCLSADDVVRSHTSENHSFSALHVLVCIHVFSLCVAFSFPFLFFLLYKSCRPPRRQSHVRGMWERCFALRALLTRAMCGVVFPLCSNNSRTNSFVFGCLVAGRIHYSHPLCHGASGCDVTCKCEENCYPDIRVLERSIVCSRSVSFIKGLAWPHCPGLGTVQSLVTAGWVPTVNTLLWMNTGTGQQNGWVLTVTPRISIWPTSLGPNILYGLWLKGTGNTGAFI